MNKLFSLYNQLIIFIIFIIILLSILVIFPSPLWLSMKGEVVEISSMKSQALV